MNQRSIGQLVLGLVIILAGVVLLLDRLDVLAAGSVWAVFWPMLLTAVGVASVLVVPRAWLGPFLVTALGVYWLLFALEVVRNSAWTYALPIAIIVLGISILVASTTRSGGGDRVTALVFLWGADRSVTSHQFKSAALTAILGGVDLDLRHAGIVGRARVDAFALLGGIDVKVPYGWRVELTGLPVLGGYDDKTNPPANPDAPVLDVHVVAMLGGVTVKHGKITVTQAPPGVPLG